MQTESEQQRRMAIKLMIIEECDKDVAAEVIDDDELLFGDSSKLQLDSLDALQLSMALQHRFGIRLADSKALRRAFATVATLDTFIQQQE
ncbi:MAG: phosphopantetheine-binding protein [Pseudomonadota bacterium]